MEMKLLYTYRIGIGLANKRVSNIICMKMLDKASFAEEEEEQILITFFHSLHTSSQHFQISTRPKTRNFFLFAFALIVRNIKEWIRIRIQIQIQNTNRNKNKNNSADEWEQRKSVLTR
jgi:hypothetical protein